MMKKLLKWTSVLTVLAILSSCLAMFGISADETDSGYTKSGTTYTVIFAEGLKAVAEGINGGTVGGDVTVKLENDIVFTESDEFVPIGTTAKPFNGTFDGNNKTISGLRLDNGDETYQALIGYTDENGCAVRDLTVDHLYRGRSV